MGYEELVNMDDYLHNAPSIGQIDDLARDRAPYVQQLVTDFSDSFLNKYGERFTTIDDIALKLSHLYFSMSVTHIKPVIIDRFNRFKMASLMELLIVQEQVLIHPDPLQSRKLNAIFAMTAAFSLVNCMITDASQDFFCNTMNTAVNDRVQGMLDDHLLWLQTKHLDEIPIFINAQFYEFMEVIHTIPLQINGF